MARQKGDLVSGKIGTVIYYVRKGKQYARFKGPDHIKQTEATKASAGKFGQASQTAKTIRTAFEALEPLCDLDTRNGLTSAVHKWMLKLPPGTEGLYYSIHGVSEFEFNKEVPLKKRLKASLEVKWDTAGKVTVSVPELNKSKPIDTPGKVLYTDLWIGVVSCEPGSNEPALIEDISIKIPYKGSVLAQDIELPVSAASNMISAVIAGIRHVYMIGGDGRLVLEEDTKWMSARVLEAVYRKD
jgi:hypothetical protein